MILSIINADRKKLKKSAAVACFYIYADNPGLAGHS